MSSIDNNNTLDSMEEQFDEFDEFDDFDDGFDDGFDDTPETYDESIETSTEASELPTIDLEQFEEQFTGFGNFDINSPEDDVNSEDTASDISLAGMESSIESGTDLFAELNAESTWTTDVQLGEDTALNGDIVADSMANAVDKNSFDGLFLDSKAATPASVGVHTSVLENGACDSNAFTLKYINIKDIIVWTPRIRGNTDITALTTSIKNDGLLLPIVVAPTKTEGRYVLIKGSRRLLACATLGMKNIPCVVNSQISNSDIHVVEPIYSHNRPYSVSEMLSFIEYIKKEKGIDNPSMIEYLLNMDSGVYMKLMDVMDDNDDEIVSALLTGEIDIKTAYKKLEQKRKKAGRDKMADMRASKIYSDASYGTDITANSGETNAEGEQLTDEEIQGIIGDIEDIDNISGEQLEEQGKIKGFEPHKQDPNERERLDPKLRKAVLARDENTCRLCGLSGQEYIETLDVHHIQEVFLGGTDDINNLLCACTVCHKLIHLYGRGELFIRPWDQMDEAEARKFKRIVKLGNVIRQGMAAKGMKKEQLKKLDRADTIGRRLKGSSDQVAG